MTRPDYARMLDNGLAAECLEGKAAAQRALMQRYQPRLEAFLARMVDDEAVIADLVQEAFIKMFRSLESFDSRKPFRPWLMKIAVNVGIDYQRKRRAEMVELEEAEAAPVSQPTSAPTTGDRPARQQRRRAKIEAALEEIEKMDRKMRRIMKLRLEENSYHEIARRTGYPLGTIKNYIHQARKRLEKLREEETS